MYKDIKRQSEVSSRELKNRLFRHKQAVHGVGGSPAENCNACETLKKAIVKAEKRGG